LWVSDFSDPAGQFRLNRWLYALCWTGTDRPGVLFERATAWLVAQKVLLPAVTTLERHVARLRSRVEERVWSMLAAAATLETRCKLESLLAALDGGRQSLLDRLRKGPYRRSAPELVRALERVEEIRQLGIRIWPMDRIPPKLGHSEIKGYRRYHRTHKRISSPGYWRPLNGLVGVIGMKSPAYQTPARNFAMERLLAKVVHPG
jgi:hypothetical protein